MPRHLLTSRGVSAIASHVCVEPNPTVSEKKWTRLVIDDGKCGCSGEAWKPFDPAPGTDLPVCRVPTTSVLRSWRSLTGPPEVARTLRHKGPSVLDLMLAGVALSAPQVCSVSLSRH